MPSFYPELISDLLTALLFISSRKNLEIEFLWLERFGLKGSGHLPSFEPVFLAKRDAIPSLTDQSHVSLRIWSVGSTLLEPHGLRVGKQKGLSV